MMNEKKKLHNGKGKVYPDLNSFINDFKRIEHTLTNILP